MIANKGFRFKGEHFKPVKTDARDFLLVALVQVSNNNVIVQFPTGCLDQIEVQTPIQTQVPLKSVNFQHGIDFGENIELVNRESRRQRRVSFLAIL